MDDFEEREDDSLLADFQIEGVDLDDGLGRLGGDEDLFIEVLEAYVKFTPGVIDQVRIVPSVEGLKDYAVAIHGIKGSSLNIGAVGVGKMAEYLEHAAKAGMLDLVLAKHDEFIWSAEKLIIDFRNFLDSLSDFEKEDLVIKARPDHDVLINFFAATCDFDMTAMENNLGCLEEYSYQMGGELIVYLREKLDNLEYESIFERLSQELGVTSESARTNAGHDKSRVLVVDDNPANLRNISSYLSELYRISMARSGSQALSIAAKSQPDLILLDIDMPEMDGFETMARIRNNSFLSRIPVIFLTANKDVSTEVKALESGAKDFVTKPIDKTTLQHRIKLHLKFSQYQQHLENTVKELEDSMVTSFSGLIECRDGNTGGHVQRTRHYVELMGQFLIQKGYFSSELNPRELDLIARAAPLHDIGKIGVSDSILLKCGKLDDVEYEIMKNHTVIGAEIIKKMHQRSPTQHYLLYAQKIAASHHERYDGHGYPQGLVGEEIPLCSRIMAVADVYDALVEDRIYRTALSHEEATQIIVSGRGTIFDPILVDVFEAFNESFTHQTGFK